MYRNGWKKAEDKRSKPEYVMLQDISAKQAEERRQAALERARRQKEAQARKEFLKRVGIIIVCVILVLALSIPTVGLMFLGGNS